jgi:NlpC/P60 family putative phage cell wall peptidase
MPPAYSRDWAEAGGEETMLAAAARHLERIASADLAPGDAVIFRLRPGVAAKHAAIVASASTMIHAMEGAPVFEVSFSNWWRRRVAGAFRFPNLKEER